MHYFDDNCLKRDELQLKHPCELQVKHLYGQLTHC
jgi:hypothetical protein